VTALTALANHLVCFQNLYPTGSSKTPKTQKPLHPRTQALCGSTLCTRWTTPVTPTTAASVQGNPQFAFLPGRGTTSELIQLLNVLEEIQDPTWRLTCQPRTSGGALIPQSERDIVLYLTNLGAMSSYRLTSPYGMRKNLDPTVEGVDAGTDNPWIPDRGGTQGDPLNTLGWVAFFDILLKALNVVQVKYPFYIRHSGSMLLPQRAACYADNTHGIFPCRVATDLSNCISSAFAGMFGIAFHPEKLRAITTAKVPGVMTLYDWNWTSITKEFGDRTAFNTSLGVSFNLRGTPLSCSTPCVLHWGGWLESSVGVKPLQWPKRSPRRR
jgi:hypothetical protein